RASAMTQRRLQFRTGVGSALRYPETRVGVAKGARGGGSCCRAQVDLIAKGTNVACQPLSDGGLVALAAGQVGGPQIVMGSAVTQDVIDRGQDRGRHGDDGLLVADTRLEAAILRPIVAAALAPRGAGTLHQHRLEPGPTLLDASRALLAGALVQP